MCFGAVVLGGITRLTESGLSMVSTAPFHIFGKKFVNGLFFSEFEVFFPQLLCCSLSIFPNQYKLGAVLHPANE